MYGNPDSAAKSMKRLTDSIDIPGPAGGAGCGSDHQSHAAFPAFTHDMSLDGGGLRLPIRLDGIRSPARSASITTRHDDWRSPLVRSRMTARRRLSNRSDSCAAIPRPPSVRPPRKRPEYFLRSASPSRNVVPPELVLHVNGRS